MGAFLLVASLGRGPAAGAADGPARAPASGFQVGKHLPPLVIPQLESPVGTDGGQPAAFRVEGHPVDERLVPVQGSELLPRRGVPEVDRVRLAGGPVDRENLAVRAEREPVKAGALFTG